MCRPIKICDASRLEFHPLQISKHGSLGDLVFETGYQLGLPTMVFDQNLKKDDFPQTP